MGFWGTLKDVSLIELLLVLEGRTGTLKIFPRFAPRLSLVIRDGKLVEAWEGRRRLSRAAVEDRLLQLAQNPYAEFAFLPGEVRAEAGEGYPLRSLALEVSALYDEAKRLEGALPHPDKEFVLTSRKRPAKKPLDELYLKALPFLKSGTSARKLAEALEVPEFTARKLLCELERMGCVEPVRSRPSHRPPFSRILVSH